MAVTHTVGETHPNLTDPPAAADPPFLNPNLPSYDIMKTLQHFDFLSTDEGLINWARWRLRYYSPNGAGLCCDSCLLIRNLHCQMVEGGTGCRTCKDLGLWCSWNRASPLGPSGYVLPARYYSQQLSTACDSCRDGRESACDPWTPGGCHVCRQQNDVACTIGGNTVGSPLELASRSDSSRPDHFLDWGQLLTAGRDLLRLANTSGSSMTPQITRHTIFSLREPHIQQRLGSNLHPLPPAPNDSATLAPPNNQDSGYPPPDMYQNPTGAPIWQPRQESAAPASPLLSQAPAADSPADWFQKFIDPALVYEAPGPSSSNNHVQWAPDPNDSYGTNQNPSGAPVWQHQQESAAPASSLFSQTSTADFSADLDEEGFDPALLYHGPLAVDKGKAPERPYSLFPQSPVGPVSEGYTPGTSTPESSQAPPTSSMQPSGTESGYVSTEPSESRYTETLQPEVAHSTQPSQSAREYYTPEELPDYSHIIPIPREAVLLNVLASGGRRKGRPNSDRCVGCQHAHLAFRGPCGYEPTQGCLRCARFGVVCVKNGFALPPHPERPRGTPQPRFGPCHACQYTGRFCDPSSPCYACATGDLPALCERNTERGLFDRPVPGDDMRGFTGFWCTRPNDWTQPVNYHVELARKWCEAKGQQWPGPEDLESLPPQNAVWVGDWEPEERSLPNQAVQSPDQTPKPVQTPNQLVGTPPQVPPDPTLSTFVPGSLVTPSPSLGPSPPPGHWDADLEETPNVPALQNWKPGSHLPKLPSWVVKAATPNVPAASPNVPYSVLMASRVYGNQSSDEEIRPFGLPEESLRFNPSYPDPTVLAPTDRWDWNNYAADEGGEGRLMQDEGLAMPPWDFTYVMPLAFAERLHVPDLGRLRWYWNQASAPRLVLLQADEHAIAQHISPLEDRTIEGATAVPVERAPSPPPPMLPYAADRIDLIPPDDAEARPGLALIPLQRLWEPNGQLSGQLSLPERAMLTGGCQALVLRQEAIEMCDKPCQSLNSPESGGICESTQHHPKQRVWVCNDHDEHGRAVASLLLDQEEGGYIWAALRHYACVDCSEAVRYSGGDQFAGTGCRVFAGQRALVNPERAENNHGGTLMRGGRYGLFPGTGCGCLTKVTARRLCLPHRLEACLEVRRRHPLTRQYDAARGALCPFCEAAPSADPANLPVDLRELAWMCKCCFGIVMGVPVDPMARQLRRPQPVHPEHHAAGQTFGATPSRDASATPLSSLSTTS